MLFFENSFVFNKYKQQGDYLQLPPVHDEPIYARMTNKSTLKQRGQLAWNSFTNDVWVLDEQVRQMDDPEWGKELDKCRDADALRGTVEKHNQSVSFWNDRWIVNAQEKDASWKDCRTDNTTCILAARRRDVKTYNFNYLKCRTNIHKFVSAASGTTKHKKGMISSINPCLYVSKDSIVKLTINIAPELMLYNGSRGRVVDVIYEPSDNGYKKNGTQNAMIIVDFKEYVGPPLWAGAPKTWVAIDRSTLNCDSHCCSQTGYPLMVGKADSIHCSQGMTIGAGKEFERVLVKWSSAMENAIGPGLFYVAASRCKCKENVAFEEKLSRACIGSIAMSTRFKETKTQDERLRAAAEQQRTARKVEFVRLNRNDQIEYGSREDLKLRMHWFYKTCQKKHALPNPNERTAGSVPLPPKTKIIYDCLEQWRASFEKEFQFDLNAPLTDRVSFVARTRGSGRGGR